MTDRVTLRMVADAAGVSTATASLALSGSLRVAEKTRKIVHEVGSRLGYVRNPALSSLGSGHFRNSGKKLAIAAWMSPHLTALFQRLAPPMGMTVQGISASHESLDLALRTVSASALVVDQSNADMDRLARLPIHVVFWKDEGNPRHALDVIETHEWWGCTVEAITQIRHAGYCRPAAILRPARPYHRHDAIRASALKSLGIPLLEGDADPSQVLSFVRSERPDAILGGFADMHRGLHRLGIQLPFAALLGNDAPFFHGVTGWLVDEAHRAQVTLDVIEHRLRYGQQAPRRIIVQPRWCDGGTLPKVQ